MCRGTAPWSRATCTSRREKEPKPLVFYVPGCDQTKEAWPHPYYNQALQRGMHAFSFDGPGQGESNLRGIRLTADNYEDAASAAIDYLVKRPEVDPKKIGVYALSFGSHWGMRIAATEHRIAAVAAPWASYVDKYYLLTEESPRYKQLFAYLTQSATEEELDKVVAGMTMDGLMQTGEVPDAVDDRRVRSARAGRGGAAPVRPDESAGGAVAACPISTTTARSRECLGLRFGKPTSTLSCATGCATASTACR